MSSADRYNMYSSLSDQWALFVQKWYVCFSKGFLWKFDHDFQFSGKNETVRKLDVSVNWREENTVF